VRKTVPYLHALIDRAVAAAAAATPACDRRYLYPEPPFGPKKSLELPRAPLNSRVGAADNPRVTADLGYAPSSVPVVAAARM
jgi:hypothetical protein